MQKPRAISGFPEWSPAQTLAEQSFLRTIVRVYESYGYTPLDSPSVERVSVLTAKGVVDKEIYGLERLKADSRSEGPPELGLKFDHTIPFARYVGQHYGQLSFPFKRYQVGKVWRGERPQEGRFREFYQADMDVVAEEHLPLHFDAEMPRVVLEIFEKTKLRARVRINNRKLLVPLYEVLGVPSDRLQDCLREADKLDKIGVTGLTKSLTELGLKESVIEKVLAVAQISGNFETVEEKLRELKIGDPSLEEGLSELKTVSAALSDIAQSQWCIDLGIVRGLDYYTGTIYEANLIDYPQLGSVCSGGRYDDLASGFIKRKLPGVGISIGVSRLISYLFKKESLKTDRQCPTEVLIILPSEDDRSKCQSIAKRLRDGNVPTEIFHLAQNMKKQLRYADRKGIPYVLFPHAFSPESPTVEVKCLASGEQQTTTIDDWLKQR